MPIRKSEAQWEGTLKQGQGKMKLGSGAFEGAYSFGTRFEDEAGTNPEELIAAAHAGCFSMAFAAMLEKEGFEAESVETTAEVKVEAVGEGFGITHITLKMQALVPGIQEERFQTVAENAKSGCPVSKALAGVNIALEAQLKA